jgi:hypothetical protein
MQSNSLLFGGPERAVRPWPAHLAMLAAVALLAVLVARVDRSLELSDEAYYLLHAIHAHDIQVFFSPFHWVSGLLWELTGSLVAFRLAGLLLDVTAAVVLASGALRAARQLGMPSIATAAGRHAVLAIAASAALAHGSLLSLTPSYNSIAATCTGFATGLCLLSLGAERRRALLLAAAAGVATGLCFLGKFSSGICTAGLLVVLWGLLASGRARLLGVPMLACAAATVWLTAQAHGGFALAMEQLRTGIGLVWLATGDGSTERRLLRSFTDIRQLGEHTLHAFWGPIGCFVLALRWWRGLLPWVGVLWFAVLLATGLHLDGGYGRYALQAQPLLAAVLMALLAWWPHWCRDLRRLALVAALLGLPLAVAIGTSNPLQMEILLALASWGALLGLLGFASAQRGPATALSVLFSLVILAQVIGSASEPYRVPPLAQHTERITVPRLGEVRVDPVTASLARQFQQGAAACGIAPGQPFLDLYNAPGIALLLDLKPVVAPWLGDPHSASLLLARAKPQDVRQAVVAARHHPGQRLVPPRQLAGFPTGYRLCATAASPYDGARMELWAPPR